MMLEKYHGTAWHVTTKWNIIYRLSFWGREGGTAHYQAYHLRALKQGRSPKTQPSPHLGRSGKLRREVICIGR